MPKHVFGGNWTTEKLDRVQKYLCAYTRIFKSNFRASFFNTVYVDAFAGTGQRVSSGADGAVSGLQDDDADSLKKGSARIALEVEPPFDKYIFIEKRSSRAKVLEALRQEFPARATAIQIERADANTFLKNWCGSTDWSRHRAVVFLDPYGMQTEWATIESIAKTKAIDLWLLFPLGMAVNRLLTKKKPPPEPWAQALTRAFGTDEWKPAFYPKKTEITLFGEEESQRKHATFDAIGQFLLGRLRTVFAQVAPNPLELRNAKGVPIFLLCFAAGNSKGAATAVKIAKDILKDN